MSIGMFIAGAIIVYAIMYFVRQDGKKIFVGKSSKVMCDYPHYFSSFRRFVDRVCWRDAFRRGQLYRTAL